MKVRIPGGSSAPARNSHKARWRTLQRCQPRLGHLHIMGVVSPTHAYTPDNTGRRLDRIATAEDDQPIRLDNAMQQRWVVLHKIEPFVCRHTKADRRIGLVLRNLDAQECCAVHATERFERAIAI